MATTATLVEQGNNRLRYLLSTTSTSADTVTITTTGAASPDLLTDTLFGPLKVIANAFTNGLGPLAAGAKTQAQARAMWLADDAGNAILGNLNVPRSIMALAPRDNGAVWAVDANVDGGGHPVVVVTTKGVASGTSACYLDVISQGAIGR